MGLTLKVWDWHENCDTNMQIVGLILKVRDIRSMELKWEVWDQHEKCGTNMKSVGLTFKVWE